LSVSPFSALSKIDDALLSSSGAVLIFQLLLQRQNRRYILFHFIGRGHHSQRNVN